MEKNQLRTGNIIQTESAIYKVENISGGMWGLDCYDIKTGQEMCVSVENAQPVPLTEEWLFKLGFNIIARNEFYFYRLPNNFGVSMWMGGKPMAGFEEKGVCYYEDGYLPIRFIHELQNLYHVMSQGKELEYESL